MRRLGRLDYLACYLSLQPKLIIESVGCDDMRRRQRMT
jgi:hypothetical protein